MPWDVLPQALTWDPLGPALHHMLCPAALLRALLMPDIEFSLKKLTLPKVCLLHSPFKEKLFPLLIYSAVFNLVLVIDFFFF